MLSKVKENLLRTQKFAFQESIFRSPKLCQHYNKSMENYSACLIFNQSPSKAICNGQKRLEDRKK